MSIALVALTFVNIAGLAIARRRQRGRELALHVALGARRRELIALSLSQVLPLVVIGTVAGIIAAPVVLRGILPWMPPDMRLLKTPEIDWRVVSFAALASIAAAAITCAADLGAVPDRGVVTGLGQGQATTPRRGKFAAVVIAVQVAMASVLTIAGLLLVSSLWLVWRQDPGYRVDQTLVFDFSPGAGPGPERLARVSDFVDATRRLPGVEQVGAIGAAFLHSSSLSPGIDPPPGAERVDAQAIPVAGDALAILGLQPIEGRLLTADEVRPDGQAIVVSERIAKAYWPGRSSIGQTVQGAQGRTWTVVGVVPDARYGALDASRYGQIYRPYVAFPYSSLLILTHSPSQTLRAVINESTHVGGGFGITRAVTMTQALGQSIGLRIFRAWLFGGFALVALVITSVGILGIVAMTSSRRTRELGIRVALGAPRAAVVRLLVREQLLAVLVGLAGGGIVAAWVVRFVRGYLYQFTPFDVRLWAVGAATVVVSALVGALIPAVRASRVDPIVSLRVP